MSDLTKKLHQALDTKLMNDDIDLHSHVNDVLKDVGLSINDSGGPLCFYGKDPLIQSGLKFGAMAAIGLACKAIAATDLWRFRGGDSQDIAIDIRKAFQRFAGFYDGEWEKISNRGPANKWNQSNPFFQPPLFRLTKDGQYVVALNTYPDLHTKALNALNCADNTAAVNTAIGELNSDQLEAMGDEAGIVVAKVRTTKEFMQELQYKDFLANSPLISIEKIGDTDPIPFTENPAQPLSSIRALGMGHVIAGAGIGRDLASFGADVLNIWRPNDCEIEFAYWNAQVGMRSTYLGEDKADLETFNRLLRDADVFFINRQPRFVEKHGLNASTLCSKKPGLVHAQVVLHGESGPWANRPGFDLIGACVTGIFTSTDDSKNPLQPPIVSVVDNVVGWLGTVGIMAALKRRAIEGGSYSVKVSLTRTCLWLISLGIFDDEFVKAKAGSDDEHSLVAPDLFTANTPLGFYQGMTDQIIFSSLKQQYKTVLEPMGSSLPEWRDINS